MQRGVETWRRSPGLPIGTEAHYGDAEDGRRPLLHTYIWLAFVNSQEATEIKESTTSHTPSPLSGNIILIKLVTNLLAGKTFNNGRNKSWRAGRQTDTLPRRTQQAGAALDGVLGTGGARGRCRTAAERNEDSAPEMDIDSACFF